MKQPCASAAGLRGSGPILTNGSMTMFRLGSPPPRIVLSSLPRECGRALKLDVGLLFLPFVRRRLAVGSRRVELRQSSPFATTR